MATNIDPVSLEILWSRLIAISEEQAATVLRTAFSNIVRESQDFSCVLLTKDGDLLAQPFQSLPGFTRAASTIMKAFLKRWQEWHPGDVAVTNDPWISAGHLHDVATVMPVFHHGKLVAFCANIAHQADIGGRGYSAEGASIFEEGLALPPMKLYKKGEVIQEVLDIIAENVRVPGQVLGDIQAQVAAARIATARTSELLTEAGLENLDELATEILTRTERAMRAAIARVPNGVYLSEGTMDGYDKPLPIRCKLTVRDNELEYDFAGTAAQINKGINACFNFTYGYLAFANKAVLEPLIPNNEGAYKPIIMKAPEGSLVNSKRPAPGNSRGRVGHMIVPVAFGALAQALPDLVPAEPGAPAPRLNFSGNRQDGAPFQCLVITSGGMGAGQGRDGLSGKAFPTNTKMAPMEIMEASAPIRFLRRELIPNSGGTGQWRGGLSQEITIQALGNEPISVALSADRALFAPAGARGGGNGAVTGLNKNGTEYLAPKATTILQPGETVTVRTPGGGGYGPDSQRNAQSVKDDLENGYVTPGVN